MKIMSEQSLRNFGFWCGAKDFAEKLTDNELDQVESYIEGLCPDGIDKVDLNDLFWFEQERICDWLGLDYDEVMERK